MTKIGDIFNKISVESIKVAMLQHFDAIFVTERGYFFKKNTTNFFKLSIRLLLIINKLHTCYSNISLCRIANPAQRHNTEHPPCWKQCKQMNICNDGETCCLLPSEPHLCLDIGVILCVEAHLRRNRSFLVEEMPIPSFNFVCFVQVPHMRLLLRTHFFYILPDASKPISSFSS